MGRKGQFTDKVKKGKKRKKQEEPGAFDAKAGKHVVVKSICVRVVTAVP
jgi:hypothetical protein